MWPNLDKIINLEHLKKLEQQFSNELSDFVRDEQLDQAFIEDFKAVYLPLAVWIKAQHQKVPLVIGINGAQGSGKSTLCKLLVQVLKQLFNKSALHLSIDDLYLSRKQRLVLSKTIHPLLKVRGVPGTHDVKLGLNLLENIKHKTKTTLVCPVFDKSKDDVLPENQWKIIPDTIDIVLFEGWCVGALPQPEDALKMPINQLESTKDKDACWRHYVNQQLMHQYQALFSQIDYLIMLKVPDFESVYKWRKRQEDKLRETSRNNKCVMSDEEIENFVLYFERITRQCLIDMPGRASVLFCLNECHQIDSICVKSSDLNG